MAQRVVVLGGGVAGLSAAHELIERGFDVEVYEAQAIPGGKARSIPVPGSGTLGPNGMRKDLPGEHGFRFFPRFYSHVTDTMKRIPYGRDRTVFDNLVDTTRLQLTRFDRAPDRSDRPIAPDARRRESAAERHWTALPRRTGPVPRRPRVLRLAHLADRDVMPRTPRERIRKDRLVGLHRRRRRGRSPIRILLGHGITRSLVAAKARLASTKTIGNIFVQLLFDIVGAGPSSDRVLNGPTNDVWIAPWLAVPDRARRALSPRLARRRNHLRTRSDSRRDRAQAVERREEVAGDYYVCALPVEDVVALLTPRPDRGGPGTREPASAGAGNRVDDRHPDLS